MLVPCVLAADTSTANFSAASTSGTAPFSVKINIIGWNGPYQLDYGDKFNLLTSDKMNMTDKVNMQQTHRYQVPGTYTITMTLFGTNGKPLVDANGNKIQIIKQNYITVTPASTGSAPTDARFTFTQATGSATVEFRPIGTVVYSGPTAFYWDFGDGMYSNSQFPTHTYKNAGTYSPQLAVGNTVGSAATVLATGPTITIPDTNGLWSSSYHAASSTSASSILKSDWYSYSG